MKKKNIFLILFLFLFILIWLGVNFSLKPYLYEREITRIVEAVLINWRKGDLPKTFGYWEDVEKSPPIYSLTSYKITKKVFQKEDNIFYAKVFVILEFPPENFMPSGKEWIFELKETSFGWKIVNFEPNKKDHIRM